MSNVRLGPEMYFFIITPIRVKLVPPTIAGSHVSFLRLCSAISRAYNPEEQAVANVRLGPEMYFFHNNSCQSKTRAANNSRIARAIPQTFASPYTEHTTQRNRLCPM